MRLTLYIERLVLDGALLDGERVGDVRAALEHRLTQLLAQPGTLDALRRVGAIDRLSALALSTARRPHESLGRRIASAVGDGLGLPPLSAAPTARGRAARGARP